MALRKLTEADLPLVLTWRNAPEVRNKMYSRHEISKPEHLAWFARMEQDPQSRWYVHQDELANPDGVVYFTQYQPENRSSFWGFYAAPEAPAGTGTALAVDALYEAFNILKLHKLNAEALATNERSLLFHEKLGFRQEGLFRDFYFDGERFVDVVRLGMLSSEWTEKRPELQRRIAAFEAIVQSTAAREDIES